MPVWGSVKENGIAAWQASSGIRCKWGCCDADSPTCPVKRALFLLRWRPATSLQSTSNNAVFSPLNHADEESNRSGWRSTFHALLRSHVTERCSLTSNYASVGAQTEACISVAARVWSRAEYANPASFKRSDSKPGDGGKGGIQMRALLFLICFCAWVFWVFFLKWGCGSLAGLMRELSCCLAKSPTVGTVWGRINRTWQDKHSLRPNLWSWRASSYWIKTRVWCRN